MMKNFGRLTGAAASRPLMMATAESFGNSEEMASPAPLPVAKVTFGFGRSPDSRTAWELRRNFPTITKCSALPLPNLGLPPH
jgi:hypothetical protein